MPSTPRGSLARILLTACLFPALAGVLATSCRHYAPDTPPDKVVRDGIVVTVRDQKLSLIRKGRPVKTYDVSTSKFGIGSSRGSYQTPLGVHAVASKVGKNAPKGMVFHGCRPTGEVVAPNSPGRDPIVSRIIQLDGLERNNLNSYARRIYIHGTAEERTIGRPASYGCIRMKSNDIVELFDLVYHGEPVTIEPCSQKTYLAACSKNNVQRVVPGVNVLDPRQAIAARNPARSSRSYRMARSSRKTASHHRTTRLARNAKGKALKKKTATRTKARVKLVSAASGKNRRNRG